METKPSRLYRSALVLFLLVSVVSQFGKWGLRTVRAEEELSAAPGKIYLPLVTRGLPAPVIPSAAPNTNNWPGGMQDVTLGTGQHMYVYDPKSQSPVPLLVGLHTWSRDYKDS